MRRAGLWHRGGRDKMYQEDTVVEDNEDAAARRKQMSLHPIVNCSARDETFSARIEERKESTMVAPNANLLPLPPHYDAARVSQLWKVPYQARATEANAWAKKHNILPAARDKKRVCLMLIDVQNTFCLPDFE